MATLPSSFNSSQHKDPDAYDLLPAGEYSAKITDSEMCKTKDGNGQYLKLKWKITAGDYEGRVVFQKLNLVNKSASAVEIAQKHLAAICRAALGNVVIGDSDELHGIEMTVKLKIAKGKDDYPDSNDFTSYAPFAGAASPAKAAASDKPAAPKKKPMFEEDDD